jgi:hypothetical protein
MSEPCSSVCADPNYSRFVTLGARPRTLYWATIVLRPSDFSVMVSMVTVPFSPSARTPCRLAPTMRQTRPTLHNSRLWTASKREYTANYHDHKHFYRSRRMFPLVALPYGGTSIPLSKRRTGSSCVRLELPRRHMDICPHALLDRESCKGSCSINVQGVPENLEF